MIASADLLEVWGAAMWRASWQGGLAALTVWSVCRLVPSIPARFQCWLWRLAMLKFSVALLWSAPLELPLLPAHASPSTTLASRESSGPIPADAIPAANAPLAQQGSSGFAIPLLIPFLAWIAMAGWQMARILTARQRANRLRSCCRLSENQTLIAQLAALSRSMGLGAPPALLEMEGQGSPLLVGILRPAIVLPATTLSRLDAGERALVIGHELAHVGRRDLFWSVFAAFVRALFCFHPLAWLGERQLGLTQEIAADELAMALQRRDPVNYATLLVSVVGKLGSGPVIPAMSVGMAGSHRSLQQRLSAMRFMKPVSRRLLVAYGIVLAAIAAAGIVPWTVVAAEAPQAALSPAAGKAPAAAKADKSVPVEQKEDVAPKPAEVDQQGKTGRGRFVSFENGTLKLYARPGVTMVWNKLPENSKTVRFDRDAGMFQPVDDAAAALKQVEPGTWVQVIVGSGNATIRINERKQYTTGTFVSFKEDRLLLMMKVLVPTSYTKKYGNQVHFNTFYDDTPIYESVDGGEYELIGTANKVLRSVKEGTILTVHGEGDDNITLIQIGVAKKK